MRRLTAINSWRAYTSGPSSKIVFEWENILSRELTLRIKTHSFAYLKLFVFPFEKYGLCNLINALRPRKNCVTLKYVMQASDEPKIEINKNVIPIIIDFWLKKEQLPAFYKAYKDVPLLLLTNKEVYDFLKQNDCQIPIEHWGLSYPDQYKLTTDKVQDKEYEFCFFGRPNPFFVRFLDEYCCKHPDFKYIRNNGDINHRQYIDNHGNIIAEDTGRESYLEMIRKTKISCYTTPGIDESKKETSSFNQVTPRLFEMLCNGCQVIGHYPKAADTDWYNLSSVVPNVDNYEEFEFELDKMRKSTFDYYIVESFMAQHYTSTRIETLVKILKKHNIQC